VSGGGRHDERGGAFEPPAGDDLLDLLYGELDGEAERAMRARVAADPGLADQLGQLERVRGLFRELADEEPPARSTAQLMAQAAQAARKGGEREGFWQRLRGWLTPIMAHPGLAAAASVILVAGVAGLLLLRKGTELTRVRSEPTALDVEMAPAAPPTAPAEERAAEVGGSAASAPASTAAATGDDDLAAEAPARAPEPKPSRRRAKARAEKEQAAGGKDAIAPPALGYKQDLPAATPRSTSADESGVEEQAEGVTRRDRAAPGANAPAPEPAPPADAPSPEQSKAPSAPGAPPASAPAKPEPAKLGSPAELHKQALDAAANSRCLEVQSLAQSVRKADAAYYDKVFRPDRRLAVCLSAGKAKRK
jgi:hypothetical protein